MKIQIKKLVSNATIPTYAYNNDGAVDLYAVDLYKNHDDLYVEYGTGLSLAIPENYIGLIFPRSSISKTSHLMCNSVGIIDSDFRGEITVRFRYLEGRENLEYQCGDRIAQLVIIPRPTLEFEEVDSLTATDRNKNGYGSSGR